MQKKTLLFHFGGGRHASFPQEPVVKGVMIILYLFLNYSETGAWLDAAAGAIVDIFRLVESEDGQPTSASKTPMEVDSGDKNKSASSKNNIDNRHRKKFNSVWVIPYLVRNLKFLQSRVLKASCTELECGNMFKPATKPTGKQVRRKKLYSCILD